MSGRLIILGGPSCVGKGPLLAALRRCRPDLPFAQPTLYASRLPRPGERDGVEFHFRTADQIRALDPERHLIFAMRNQLRAIDLTELHRLLEEHERVILELHPTQLEPLRRRLAGVEMVTVLLQPLSLVEANELAQVAGTTGAEAVAEVMRAKQIDRAMRQGKLLTGAELADIEVRTAAAWAELQPAGFDQVLVCHDHEGSDHWRFTPPIGDAGATLRAVAALL